MSVIDDLKALQELDGIIRELEQQANDIPIRRQQELDKIKLERDDFTRAEEAVQVLKDEVARGESYIAELKETIHKFKLQIPSLKTQAALDAMQSQISKTENDFKDAELSAIETHLKIEPAEQYANECKARYEEAKAEIEDYIAELDSRLADVEERLEAALEKRLEKVTPLDNPATKRFLLYYNRLKGRRWPVLAKLDENVCSGCHMELPPAKQQEVHRYVSMANEPAKMIIVTCDFCGRIVF